MINMKIDEQITQQRAACQAVKTQAAAREATAAREAAAKQEADAAAKEAVIEYAEKQKLTLELHEAECPGRRVGKGAVTILGAIAAATGTVIILFCKWIIGGLHK